MKKKFDVDYEDDRIYKTKNGKFVKNPNKKKKTKKERKREKAEATRQRKAAKLANKNQADLTKHEDWANIAKELLTKDKSKKKKLYTLGRDETDLYDDRIRTALNIISEFVDLLGVKIDFNEFTEGEFVGDDGTEYLAFNALSMAHYFDSVIQELINLSHNSRTYIKDFYPKLEEYRMLYDGSSRIDKVAFVSDIISIIY